MYMCIHDGTEEKKSTESAADREGYKENTRKCCSAQKSVIMLLKKDVGPA